MKMQPMPMARQSIGSSRSNCCGMSTSSTIELKMNGSAVIATTPKMLRTIDRTSRHLYLPIQPYAHLNVIRSIPPFDPFECVGFCPYIGYSIIPAGNCKGVKPKNSKKFVEVNC